jgi:membrane-bound lytic murein transglycosylase A
MGADEQLATGDSILVPRRAFRCAAALLAAAALCACITGFVQASSPGKPHPGSSMKSAVSYKPLAFAEVPGWDQDDHAAAFKTFLKSCGRVVAAARERTTADKVPPPPTALVAACAAASQLAGPVGKAEAKAFFERHFTANAVAHNGPRGLLTGYYEPLLQGSRTAQGIFQTPVYKRPPDLVNLVDETQRAAASSGLSHARKTDKGTEPYPTRAQIEQGALKGRDLELVYLTDPVELFFLQVQGSGRVKLTDGSVIRIHYDGKNGHPYSSIGRYLIEKGLLAADKVSMGALKQWLKADPERGKHVMSQNASYVFFRELKGPEGKGPLGAMNTQLTPGRSLAIDTSHHALGLPIYVSGEGMTHVVKAGAFNRLMIAQDVGSAIKGPERGDIYFGSGDAAGRLAGVTKHVGKFIVLLPKDTPARAEAAQEAPEKARQ